jgi:hypothetical protein
MRRRTTFLLFSFCLAAVLSVAGCKNNMTQAAGGVDLTQADARNDITQAAEGAGYEAEPAGEVVAQAAEEGGAATPEKGPEKGKVVKAHGKVRLVGSGAMPELVIRGKNKQWYVAKEDMQKLKHLQQQTVTVEGEETTQELKWANGRSAGKRRYLHNINIIPPK